MLPPRLKQAKNMCSTPSSATNLAQASPMGKVAWLLRADAVPMTVDFGHLRSTANAGTGQNRMMSSVSASVANITSSNIISEIWHRFWALAAEFAQARPMLICAPRSTTMVPKGVGIGDLLSKWLQRLQHGIGQRRPASSFLGQARCSLRMVVPGAEPLADGPNARLARKDVFYERGKIYRTRTSSAGADRGTVAPLSAAEILDRSLEVAAAEIRPQRFGKDQLGIGALPQ